LIDGDGVGSNGKHGKCVVAGIIGQRGARDTGITAGGGDGGSFDDGVAGIGDESAEAGGINLSVQCKGNDTNEDE